jgi:hypothetical protein
MGEAGSDKPGLDVHPSVPEAQALTGPSGPTNQQQESEAPSSSGVGELSFEVVIAGILVPFSQGALGTDDSANNTADMAFLKTMATGFQDVQQHYSQRWEELHSQRQAIELAEGK